MFGSENAALGIETLMMLELYICHEVASSGAVDSALLQQLLEDLNDGQNLSTKVWPLEQLSFLPNANIESCSSCMEFAGYTVPAAEANVSVHSFL